MRQHGRVGTEVRVAWLELTSSQSNKTVYINSDLVFAVLAQPPAPYGLPPSTGARLRVVVSAGGSGGSTPLSIDVEETPEQVMEMLAPSSTVVRRPQS